MRHPLVDEYLEKYVAPDGGGRLEPEDDIPALAPTCQMRTTKNENPILFLVQAAWEFCKEFPGELDAIFKAHYERHMQSTRVQTGLHARRCGDTFRIGQSHDNVVAMVIGSFLFRTPHAEEIFQFGSTHAWCFNVKQPGNFDITQTLQGGDIAICHYATHRETSPWNAVWLAVGLSISRVYNLSDLRIEFLKRTMPERNRFEKFVLGAGIWIHEIRRGSRDKYWSKNYYGPDHPFRKFFIEKSRVA